MPGKTESRANLEGNRQDKQFLGFLIPPELTSVAAEAALEQEPQCQAIRKIEVVALLAGIEAMREKKSLSS